MSFPFSLNWSGDTQHSDYPREAVATVLGKPDLELSSGPSHGGDAGAWNPEDTFGASLAQCHLLTFLAMVGKRKQHVLGVEVSGAVELTTENRRTRVGSVTLEATITVGPEADEDAIKKAYHKAHEYCYIANSTTAELILKPTVVRG